MNEKVFIVCIELQTSAAKDAFENSLRNSQYRNYQIIIEGVYAIKTPLTDNSVSLRNFVREKVGPSCSCFVMKSSLDAAWNIMSQADGWLRNNI